MATSRSATASPAPTRTSSAPCSTASTAARRTAFLEQHHIANKTDCSTCWARPLCAGGCYHEAHTRYGDDRRGRTCTTANGFAAGPTPACRSTASSPSGIRSSWRSSIATKRTRKRSMMRHLEADQQKGRDRIEASHVDDSRTQAATSWHCSRAARRQPHRAAHPARLLVGVLAGLGGGPHRRHRRALPAGRARSVRLPRRLLLAGAGAGSATTTRPTGPRSARPRRRTGARSTSSSHEHDTLTEARVHRWLAGCGVAALVLFAAARPRRRSSPAATARSTSAAVPNKIFILDEATEKVTGTIPSRSAFRRRMALSRDRKRFYSVESPVREGRDHRHRARKKRSTTSRSERGHARSAHPRRSSPIRCERFVDRCSSRPPTKKIDRYEIAPPTLLRLRPHEAQVTAPSPGRTAKSASSPTSCSRPTAS